MECVFLEQQSDFWFESWVKVMRKEGNSQAATAQAMIMVHRNHTANVFVIRA